MSKRGGYRGAIDRLLIELGRVDHAQISLLSLVSKEEPVASGEKLFDLVCKSLFSRMIIVRLGFCKRTQNLFLTVC